MSRLMHRKSYLDFKANNSCIFRRIFDPTKEKSEKMRGENKAMANRYASTFAPFLEDGERLLNANASIYVVVSKMLGRGMGDGTIGVTNRRILHRGLNGGGVTIEIPSIVSITKSWIAVPGSSQLNITRKIDGELRKEEFYCGTGFCKDIISMLSK
jgi:hypothetical protein